MSLLSCKVFCQLILRDFVAILLPTPGLYSLRLKCISEGKYSTSSEGYVEEKCFKSSALFRVMRIIFFTCLTEVLRDNGKSSRPQKNAA